MLEYSNAEMLAHTARRHISKNEDDFTVSNEEEEVDSTEEVD